MQISVIICCYNSERRIQATLEHLIRQEIDHSVHWEVILVDNNCSDQTVALAQQVWTREDAALRIVEEAIPGLSPARECGLQHATGEFILYCDDDNWLAPNYLQRAYQFMLTHSEYAAIGGWGDVVSDPTVAIPDWFEQFQTKYACGKTNVEGDVDSLVGAGVFIRKQAYASLRELGFTLLLSGRKGKALSSGEDLELSLALRITGWKLYFSEELHFKHYMPEGRLTEDYLIRMCHGHALSRPVVAEYGRLLTLRESGGGQLLRKFLPFWGVAILRLLRGTLKVVGKKVTDLDSAVKLEIQVATNEQYRSLLLTGQAFVLRQRLKENVGL